jgi:hypothetical protein
VVNERKTAQKILELKIEMGAKLPGKDYSEGSAIDEMENADFYKGDSSEYEKYITGPGKEGLAKKGVTTDVDRSKDAKAGKSSILLSASSSLSDNSGWSAAGRKLPSTLNLSSMKAIGLWVKGDGKGATVKLQLRDSQKGRADYYIKLDFVGWQYIELLEPSIDSLDRSDVQYIIFYFNNIPAKESIRCQIDGIRALKDSGKEILVNPDITINSQVISFPVTLEANGSIILKSKGECRVYDKDGNEKPVKPSQSLPELSPGENEVVFKCDGNLTNEVIVKISR